MNYKQDAIRFRGSGFGLLLVCFAAAALGCERSSHQPDEVQAAEVTPPSGLKQRLPIPEPRTLQSFSGDFPDPFEPFGCPTHACAPPSRWDGNFLREKFAVEKACGQVVGEKFRQVVGVMPWKVVGQAEEKRAIQFALSERGYLELFYEYDQLDSSVDLHVGEVMPKHRYASERSASASEHKDAVSDADLLRVRVTVPELFAALRSASESCTSRPNKVCIKGCGLGTCVDGKCVQVDQCGDAESENRRDAPNSCARIEVLGLAQGAGLEFLPNAKPRHRSNVHSW